jgi:hypothetical protein
MTFQKYNSFREGKVVMKCSSLEEEQSQNMVRFQFLTAASMKMTVFWDVEPYSLVDVYRSFRGRRVALMMEAVSTSETSTRLHGATSQKTAIFIIVKLAPRPYVCCESYRGVECLGSYNR